MFFKDAKPEIKKLIYRLVFLVDEIDILKQEQHESDFEYEEISTTIEVLRGQVERVKRELKRIDKDE